MLKITKSALFMLFICLFFVEPAHSGTVDNILGDGFRNLKWGTQSKNISGLYERQSLDDGRVSYSRQKDELSFCNVKIDTINYYFDKSGSLYSVVIRVAGKKNSPLLVDSMLKKFGKSEDITTQKWWSGPSEDCMYYFWSGKNTNVIVQYYVFGDEFINVFITQNGRTPGDW